jgi:hypothetical protein
MSKKLRAINIFEPYRDSTKEKIREKKKETITCECGNTVNKNHLSRHK